MKATGGASTAAEALTFAERAPALAKLVRSLKDLVADRSRAVSMTTRQLATLVKAGIPLVEALTALIDQIEDEDLREAYADVRNKVNEGTPFAAALANHPRLFTGLYVNMVSAGEASGTLEAVLARLADFMEAQDKLKGKVIGAMAYPAFMAFAGGAILSLMMTVVVPKVSAIFEDFRAALPWYTSALITTSRLFGSFWWLFLILLVGGVVAFNRWRATPEGRYRWDAFTLRVPVFGELLRMVAIARFARTLATLLASGVALLKAMDIVKGVMENKVLEAVITEAAVSIKEGESIAEPLKRSGRFPPIVTHMIAIGERSGELESMLEAVASSYDNAIDSRVAVLSSLMEPALILVIGGMSGGVAFAILMPLLQLNEFAQ